MPQGDVDLIEDLMYANEGVDLDFKRDQYPWVNASDLDKTELLKDILAFSDSFRRPDAHIIIGVDEPPNSRPQLVGIAIHLPTCCLSIRMTPTSYRRSLSSTELAPFKTYNFPTTLRLAAHLRHSPRPPPRRPPLHLQIPPPPTFQNPTRPPRAQPGSKKV